MKLGLGLYRHMLTPENFRFARQCGCTHIVAHLVNYFKNGQLHGTDESTTWGSTQAALWTDEELHSLKAQINNAGLELEAVENFDPAHWHDVLLDGPKKKQQIEDVKMIIRRIGKVGIPIIGYNFSIAGVWGHVVGPWARGAGTSVAFLGDEGPSQTQIPKGQVWNMEYDSDAEQGTIGTVTSEQIWHRLTEFLQEVVPVAEEAGVRLALHPDDPPMPTLRDTARLVFQPQLYDRVLDIAPSHANALEFCLGSVHEMSEGDVYTALDHYLTRDAIGYVHFRNVKGKVPHYKETFVDEGDIDMIRIMRILKSHKFQGVLIPDHTPSMACDAPWHAGMAFALGYMKAAIAAVDSV